MILWFFKIINSGCCSSSWSSRGCCKGWRGESGTKLFQHIYARCPQVNSTSKLKTCYKFFNHPIPTTVNRSIWVILLSRSMNAVNFEKSPELIMIQKRVINQWDGNFVGVKNVLLKIYSNFSCWWEISRLMM